MFIKLNSTLQTKNLMGLTDLDLGRCIQDPYYNFLRVPTEEIYKAGKSGQIVTIGSGIRLNVHRDYMVMVQANPELHSFGIVSMNTFIGGEGEPQAIVRAHRGDTDIALDWLFELRLVGKI